MSVLHFSILLLNFRYSLIEFKVETPYFPSTYLKMLFKFEKYKMLNVDKIPNPNEKIKYLSIPFINDKSEIIGRKIQEAVKRAFY
jgi:hypothetical protein